MNKCFNIIARQCMFNALQNANTIIGYKYVFCIIFGFNLLDKEKKCTKNVYGVSNVHVYLQKTVSC